jgi:hypothetical protein
MTSIPAVGFEATAPALDRFSLYVSEQFMTGLLYVDDLGGLCKPCSKLGYTAVPACVCVRQRNIIAFASVFIGFIHLYGDRKFGFKIDTQDTVIMCTTYLSTRLTPKFVLRLYAWVLCDFQNNHIITLNSINQLLLYWRRVSFQ